VGFFDKKQGAAEFKHAVLERYVPIFAQKLGLYSAGHRVHLIDGYAGPGWYGDDSPGSPALLLGTATALADRRNIECWFVEENSSNYQQLSVNLEAASLTSRAHVFHGTMADRLPEITRSVAAAPLFALVDPFGIGLPFDCLVSDLLRRAGKTEVLVSFIHAGVCRNAGRLTQQTANVAQQKIAETVLPRLDANLGGSWWHDIWLRPAFDRDRVDKIRDCYVERVLEAAGTGWQCYQVPVARSFGGATIYDMLLFTRNPQGPWFFNEAVSLARGEVEESQAQRRSTAATQPTLWDVAENWVGEIEANLRALVPPGGRPVRVIDQISAVYGRSLGYARARHVREAAERLHQQGVIVNPIKGPVEKLHLVPRNAAQTA